MKTITLVLLIAICSCNNSSDTTQARRDTLKKHRLELLKQNNALEDSADKATTDSARHKLAIRIGVNELKIRDIDKDLQELPQTPPQ